MSDTISFLSCSFCGKTDQSQGVDFILKSNHSKYAAICNECIAKAYVFMQHAYVGLYEDNGYHLDDREDVWKDIQN